MSARRAIIALFSVLAMVAPGCRALGVKPFNPEPMAVVPTIAVREMVDQHNRNAELVQSLEAYPSVSDRKIGAAQGRMALVRPRDFKLTLSAPGRGVIADVGSNDDKFWIWSSQSEEKAIYVGAYEAGGQIPPEMIFQPEWVVESLGLRTIGAEEASGITTEKGDSPSTMNLVHHRIGQDGQTLLKKTVVDRTTGQIRQHDFFAPDGKTVIARALPDDYQPVKLGSGETVLLPNKIRLTAMAPEQEPLVLNIVLGVSSVRLNQFDTSKRLVVFKVPQYEGYELVDLNTQIQKAARTSEATYATLPSPPTGETQVRLERPVSLDRELSGASSTSGPLPLTADLPSGSAAAAGGIDVVVGGRAPRPPGGYDEVVVPQMPARGIGLQGSFAP